MIKLLIIISFKLQNYFNQLIDHLAIKENNGIHPKHRLTNYHNFFVDNIKAEDTVLDVGCGNGFVACEIAQKAKKVTGIDINAENIKIAQSKFKKENLDFIVGNATTYYFTEKYNVIILSNVLEHIKERMELLNKIKNLGEKILIRIPMLNRDWSVYYKKELGLNYFSDPSHFIEYTLPSFQKEIESSNLLIDKYSIQFGEIWAIVKKK